MLLSALLGALGSVSVMAQSSNVYSLNVVGYINVTMFPGYNIITCPLVSSPDNTIATLLNNTNGQYQSGSGRSGEFALVYSYVNGGYITDQADAANTPSGWLNGGTNTISPGQAVFFYNPTTTNMTATFVGTVTNGPVTNALTPGYSLVGSMVPVTGDIVTNSISMFTNGQVTGSGRSVTADELYTYTPGAGYSTYQYSASGWVLGTTPADPTLTNVYQGFFFYNPFSTTNNWVENFSVAQ